MRTRNLATDNTRTRILNYLNENPKASVRELRILWGLTTANIRYHIHHLVDDGLVEKVQIEDSRPKNRGRPMIFYKLATIAEDNNYQELCKVLLAFIRESTGKDSNHDALVRIANFLVPNALPEESITKKLNSLVMWLNKRGYHPRWEATAEGPLIKFFHCPYKAILPEHPELCQIDRLVLTRLVQFSVKQIAQMNISIDSPKFCLFKLGSMGKP